MGSPPLVNAITFNHFDIVKLLCENKAQIEGIIVQGDLSIIDLTILHGRFEIARYLYDRLTSKTLKTPEEYDLVAKKFYMRYVNYEVFISGIVEGKSEKETGDYLTKPLIAIDTD